MAVTTDIFLNFGYNRAIFLNSLRAKILVLRAEFQDRKALPSMVSNDKC